MDYYYTSTPSVSSRGRFSSRGGGSSYRGNGRGESSSYRGSRGGSYSSSRGYTSSRGRGNYYPKYESPSSKYSSDGGTRYTSHTRMEEVSYRKPDSSYASVRDHSHHRSEVDVGRKRIRSDSYSQSQGTTGGRRSHEVEDYRGSGGGGGGGSGSRYSNSNSYTESRSYSENRGVFKKPRMTEYKPKEEYRDRKEISRSSAVSKLRSFRGRTIRGLASVRRGSDSFLARKRAAFSGSRSASDIIALKKAKMLKLKRWRDRTKNMLEEEKALAEEKKKETQEAEEQAELTKKSEEKNKEGEKEKSEEKKEREKEKEKGKDKEGKEEGEIWENETENKEKDKTKKTEDRLVDFFRKPFIKLQCPHCLTRCVTFKEYNHHLYLPPHIKAMKEKSEQLKQTLARMRVAQRAKQKKVDEEDLTSMNTRSMFCPICKLHYSVGKSVHQSSEAHKKLKNFLQPYCRICRISFKSPMAYEKHICSLDHQRRKSAADERLGKTKGSNLEYLDNFMVLDSVGSGDEVEGTNNIKTEEEVKKEKEKEKTDKKSDEEMNLGVEFIRKVEALYCEVCRTYLSLVFDQEKVLRIHCRSKYHLKCYMRFGSAELLAEIQGKENPKEETENGEAKPNEKGGKDVENHEKGGEEEAGIDDKIWPDVSDILSQVELDDEDEEEGSGRFDRFKSNEKKENGEVDSTPEAVGEQEKGDEPIEEAKQEVKEDA